MNTLILEWKNFIRSRVFVVILGVVFVLLASLFYKNYLNFQQVEADKKHELLMVKEKIGLILYPKGKNASCRYSGDKDKMALLKESLNIAENTVKLRYSGNERGFM